VIARLASYLCDGTCTTAVRAALRCARAESKLESVRDAEQLAHDAAQREWKHRVDSLLAAKADLERQLNAEREMVEQMKAERKWPA
jgi:hypothetical protein